MKKQYKGKYSKATRPSSDAATSGKSKKFAQLSKKDKEFVSEYGQLQEDALAAGSDIDDDEIMNQGQVRRRVFKEEEVDEMLEAKRKRQRQQTCEINENSDLDDDGLQLEEDQPSAYEVLLKSLKKTSAVNQKMWKQMEKEENGIDDTNQEPPKAAIGSHDSGSESVNEEEEEMLKGDDLSDSFSVSSQEDELDPVEDSVISKRNHFDLSDELVNQLEQFENDMNEKNYQVEKLSDDVLGNVIAQSLKEGPCKSNMEQVLSAADFQIKQRLIEPWKQLQKNDDQLFNENQKKLFGMLNSYRDVLHINDSFESQQSLMQVYALHSLNHVFKNRDTILKNNEKLKKAADTNCDLEIRDQGFTRPKVLVILPMRNSAYEFINLLIELSGSIQQENKKRFNDEFGSDEKAGGNQRKPLDYQQVFRGNIDDCFRIGIKFSRKAMKLYSEFYSSDIIVASPLGLRMIVGSDGDKQRDFDFLSSMEVVIADQVDVLLMQNWDHVIHIFNHLNLIPKELRDCDFSRVRSWYLDGHAKLLRQNLIFGRFPSPEINHLFNNRCMNIFGKIKTRPPSYKGTVNSVIPRVQHIFTRLETSLAKADDARFKFFTEKTIPSLKSSVSLQSHTCIVIPSYFDFLRIRNWMDKMEIPYGDVNEYSSQADAQRSRHDFLKGTVPFLLTTERAHFFRRYRIRGIKNLVFYGLPEHSFFYSDFCNMLIPDNETDATDINSMVSVLYTQYDALKLERVVGTKRVEKMICGTKSTFMFA